METRLAHQDCLCDHILRGSGLDHPRSLIEVGECFDVHWPAEYEIANPYIGARNPVGLSTMIGIRSLAVIVSHSPVDSAASIVWRRA